MKTRIESQKLVADIVLSKLELLDRNCIIAGGAPRDWYLGNVASDIDVYLYDSRTTYIHAEQRINLLNELGLNVQSKHEDWLLPELYQSNHYIKYLYNCEVLGERVQVIFVSEPTFTSVVDTFPISISKVWYKRGKISTTPDFEDSVKYKVLWKTVESYKEDNKYILKIKEKFSDYNYITKGNLIIYEKQSQLMKLVKEIIPEFEQDVLDLVNKILKGK